MGQPGITKPGEHHSHAKTYWVAFVGLIILTALELKIPELQSISYAVKASSVTLLAFGKAFIVAYYYMHLNEEKTWLRFIAAIPISAAIYATVVILESLYR